MESEYRYKILYAIAKELSSSLVADEVLNSMVEGITKAIDAKGCSLMLLTPDKEQLIHTISYGLSNWYLQKGPIRADAIVSEVLQGKPVAILHATQDPRVQYKEETMREGIVSTLSIPLMPRGEVMGIMRVYTSEPRQFSSEDIDFLSALANLGAIALEKARLHESLGERLDQCSIELTNLEQERNRCSIELTNLEQERNRCSIELTKLEQGRNRFLHFLGIVAHDLKAPLAAIQSYFGIMLGGFSGELTKQQRKMLERSSLRITELLNLISDLLDIPRIETGQIVQEMKEVSLRQVVRHSLDDLRNLAKRKGVKLTTELPQALPKVYGSAPRLQQVITNLVNNAISYTPEGVVTIKVREGDNDIEVEVMDTGIGIPPEDLPLVFNDFFRGSNVEMRGTGLGLSIARRIVEAHGGRIWVESPCPGSNHGSKFTLTLPKKSET